MLAVAHFVVMHLNYKTSLPSLQNWLHDGSASSKGKEKIWLTICGVDGGVNITKECAQTEQR